MSQFTFPEAVLQRIQSFSSEVASAGHVAAYLSDCFESRRRIVALAEIRDSLERASTQLAETLGGVEEDHVEIYPLPHAEPYLIPMALDFVEEVASLSVPIVMALTEGASKNEYLALDYFSVLLGDIAMTANYLCATVREELPPLQSHAPVEARAVTA